VLHGRGHRCYAKFQFFARSGNRKNLLGLEHSMNRHGRVGRSAPHAASVVRMLELLEMFLSAP
jgi:hypothetical protein